MVFTINTGRVLSMCCHVFFFDVSSKERRVAVCNFVNPRPMRGKPQESKLEPAISVLSIFSSPEPAGPRLFPFPDLQIRTHPGSLSTGSYKLHSPVLQSETMACQRSSPQRDRSEYHVSGSSVLQSVSLEEAPRPEDWYKVMQGS